MSSPKKKLQIPKDRLATKQLSNEELEEEHLMFSQLLKEMITKHKSIEQVFHDVDRKQKGSVDINDFAAELQQNFDIDDINQQKDIFFKLSNQNNEMNK